MCNTANIRCLDNDTPILLATCYILWRGVEQNSFIDEPSGGIVTMAPMGSGKGKSKIVRLMI